MAPELVTKGTTQDELVDIWALGVITYYMLSGCYPFLSTSKELVHALIKKGDYDEKGGKMKNSSDGARDFIKKCLTIDRSARMHAEDLLSHDWITSNAPNKVPKPEEIKESFKNTLHFATANKFQRSIIAILLGLKARPEDVEKCKLIFKHIDEDNNGCLEPGEIRKMDKIHKVLTDGVRWGPILRSLDMDGNGKIDFQEFFTSSCNHRAYLNQENIDYCFNTFDKKKNGYIAKDDFNFILPTNKWPAMLKDVKMTNPE